jgi:ABC-2 type transport system permease protein
MTQQIAWFGSRPFDSFSCRPHEGRKVRGAAAEAAPTSPVSGDLSTMSPMVLGVAVAYFIVGFVFYATLYAAAGSMVNSEQEAQQAAAPVMVLVMSAWLCVNPVMLAPSGKLAVALSWLPWSSPIIMPIRMGLTSVSPVEIVGSDHRCGDRIHFHALASARIYRVGMLMYGKKPSFREVAKWIRYA